MKLKSSTIVKAPREIVFRIWSNFKDYPKILPGYFTSVKIISREGNTVITETTIQEGAKIRKGKLIFTPPIKMELEFLSGDYIGTKHVWHFTKVPEGTKVDYEADYRFKGITKKILPVFLIKSIKAHFEELTRGFVKTAEEKMDN